MLTLKVECRDASELWTNAGRGSFVWRFKLYSFVDTLMGSVPFDNQLVCSSKKKELHAGYQYDLNITGVPGEVPSREGVMFNVRLESATWKRSTRGSWLNPQKPDKILTFATSEVARERCWLLGDIQVVLTEENRLRYESACDVDGFQVGNTYYAFLTNGVAIDTPK